MCYYICMKTFFTLKKYPYRSAYMCSRLIIQPHTKAEREREGTEKNTCSLKITKKWTVPQSILLCLTPLERGEGGDKLSPLLFRGPEKIRHKNVTHRARALWTHHTLLQELMENCISSIGWRRPNNQGDGKLFRLLRWTYSVFSNISDVNFRPFRSFPNIFSIQKMEISDFS